MCQQAFLMLSKRKPISILNLQELLLNSRNRLCMMTFPIWIKGLSQANRSRRYLLWLLNQCRATNSKERPLWIEMTGARWAETIGASLRSLKTTVYLNHISQRRCTRSQAWIITNPFPSQRTQPSTTKSTLELCQWSPRHHSLRTILSLTLNNSSMISKNILKRPRLLSSKRSWPGVFLRLMKRMKIEQFWAQGQEVGDKAEPESKKSEHPSTLEEIASWS